MYANITIPEVPPPTSIDVETPVTKKEGTNMSQKVVKTFNSQAFTSNASTNISSPVHNPFDESDKEKAKEEQHTAAAADSGNVPYFANLDHFRQITAEGRVDRRTLRHWFDWSISQEDKLKKAQVQKSAERRREAAILAQSKVPRKYKLKPLMDLFEHGNDTLALANEEQIGRWEYNAMRKGEVRLSEQGPVLMSYKKYVLPTVKRAGNMPQFFARDSHVFMPELDEFPEASVKSISRQLKLLKTIQEKRYDEDIIRRTYFK